MIFLLGSLHKPWTKTPTIYNIIHWLGGSLGQMTHRPSVWCSKYYFFFHNFLQNSLQKSFQFIFLFFYNFTKIKIKSFECPKSIRNYEKNNAWNIRRLVDESFVPATPVIQRIILKIVEFQNSPGQRMAYAQCSSYYINKRHG